MYKPTEGDKDSPGRKLSEQTSSPKLSVPDASNRGGLKISTTRISNRLPQSRKGGSVK